MTARVGLLTIKEGFRVSKKTARVLWIVSAESGFAVVMFVGGEGGFLWCFGVDEGCCR